MGSATTPVAHVETFASLPPAPVRVQGAPPTRIDPFHRASPAKRSRRSAAHSGTKGVPSHLKITEGKQDHQKQFCIGKSHITNNSQHSLENIVPDQTSPQHLDASVTPSWFSPDWRPLGHSAALKKMKHVNPHANSRNMKADRPIFDDPVPIIIDGPDRLQWPMDSDEPPPLPPTLAL